MRLDPDLVGSSASLSASYITSVLPELLDHYGLDVAAVLADAGIEPERLQQPDALLCLSDVVRLFMVVLQRTRDSGLGFEVGRCVKARSYHVLGYVILSSSHLGEAVDRLVRFEKLAGNLGATTVEHLADRVRLIWRCPLSGPPAVFITEAAITGWVAFARQMVSGHHAPLRVCFKHQKPLDAARYEAFFGGPVCFGEPFDGVELDSQLMQMPLASADPGLNQMMEREALTLLTDYDLGSNLVNAVRGQVYRLLADGEPSIDQVAQRLGIAERTLQSRLRKQGESYQGLLDGLRRSLSEIYLQDLQLSLTDIALLLGFAEQSSFTRAFRRWWGISPQAARQKSGRS